MEPTTDEEEAARAAKFARQVAQRWRRSRFHHQPEQRRSNSEDCGHLWQRG